jgi:hypothetical protein
MALAAHPVNAAWVARRKPGKAEKPEAGKEEAQKAAPRKPAPRPAARKELPPPEGKPAQGPAQGEEALEDLDDYEEIGLLSIQKTRAEIRFKNEQADATLQKRLERLGELIDRELVAKAFSKLAQEIKTRFVELPQRASPAITAIVKAGGGEHDVQKYLEAEIGKDIQAIKSSLAEF